MMWIFTYCVLFSCCFPSAMQPHNRILDDWGLEHYMLLNSFWTVDIKNSQMFWPVLSKSQICLNPASQFLLLFLHPILLKIIDFHESFHLFSSSRRVLWRIRLGRGKKSSEKNRSKSETMSQSWEQLKHRKCSQTYGEQPEWSTASPVTTLES